VQISAAQSSGTGSLQALILTGQSRPYHHWQTSSNILNQLLEQTGLFKVDTAVSPPQNGDMGKFCPTFADYNVVVVDYQGDDWSERAKTAFVDYVKNGGGVVIYHSTSWNFSDWDEWNKIIGLKFGPGTHEDRKDYVKGLKKPSHEKLGPYLFWRDGEIVRDYSEGFAGSEVAPHQFAIVVRDYQHPVTKGLPKEWLHVKEGLYTRLRGPAEKLTVLATAWADPNIRCLDGGFGSGRHEPVLFTVNYGKGRVFHTVLGHVSPPGKGSVCGIDSVDFIVTFQRGAEWAATGRVTQKVPDDFPTATEVRRREGILEDLGR
jgi:type 1 glutamine amidotransferase